ncbi:hypothetical protein PRIEUP_LOCUS1526, partial [Pristimantis euphronides]
DLHWQTEKPSSSSSTSVCTPTSVHLFNRVPLEDPRVGKRKPEVSGDASHQCDVLPESSSASEFQSSKKGRYKKHDDFETMRSSSFSYMGSPQHSSAEVFSSQSSSNVATYTHHFPKEQSCVTDTFGEEIHIVKDVPQNSLSQISVNYLSKIEAVQEMEPLNNVGTANSSEVSASENTAIPGPSSSTSTCSSEPSSEQPSTSHAQRKTSKTLSPDILHLLKGKDANTVTNILRTLSPFYPALQEVNLEILAQVLVNTGVLD